MEYLSSGPESGPLCIFAHGAGAPMDSDFMEDVSDLLSKEGIKVVRFEFPYMQERRINGKKRPPNRQPELLSCLENVISHFDEPCVLMGKSMGGRMSSILAADEKMNSNVKGVVALGYPFHPAGKQEKLRIEHLPQLKVPMSIVQGTRDALGNKETVENLSIPSEINFLWLDDGDHDLKPRKKSGFTHEGHKEAAARFAADFIKRQLSE